MEPPHMFVLLAVTIGVVNLLTGPIGTAIGDRIRRGGQEAAINGLALDFAERLPARRVEVDQIQGGAIR